MGSHFLPQGAFLTRDRTCVSCLAGIFFTTELPGKPVFSLGEIVLEEGGPSSNNDWGPYKRRKTQTQEGTREADVGVMLAAAGGGGCHLQAEEG